MNELTELMKAKAGNQSALGKLLNQFNNLLRARARESFDERLRGRIGESDLVQMTLLTATEGFPAFRGTSEAELVAWLKAILEQQMVAAARRHLTTKKRSASNEVALPGPTSECQIAGGIICEPTAKGSTASHCMMREELREHVNSAIKNLPWEQQAAVRLKFIDEYTLSEVADFLGKSERAVAGLIARGMKRLKDALKDFE